MLTNPRAFYPNVFTERKLSKQKSFGFPEEELYPHLIFSGNPFSDEHIRLIDYWLSENRAVLPLSLESLSFKDVVLLIRYSHHFINIIWQIYHEPTDLILGDGILEISDDGKYFDTASTFIDFQGFGIYPVVIRRLYQELGPIRSDVRLNHSATKVWAKLGARVKDKRWVLD